MQPGSARVCFCTGAAASRIRSRVPGCNWMTRDYLRACFAYPFLVCGVQRLSGYVNSSNLAARRLNEHFGYRVEATLKGAAPDGGDVLIYVMWRKDCRYV